jgi:hypothetical protein
VGPLLVVPGVAVVAGGGDHQRRRPSPAEGGIADITSPKWSLEAALSAQICSLSAKVAEDCLLAITGRIQLSLPATTCGVSAGRPSRRETAIASGPLKACWSRSVEKLAVRLAKYSRDPLAQSKVPSGPGRGPKGHRWVAVGDQALLVVPGKGPDRPHPRGAGEAGRARHSGAPSSRCRWAGSRCRRSRRRTAPR